MTTTNVWELIQFLNKEKYTYPGFTQGHQIIMRSSGCKDYQLVLEYVVVGDSGEWRLALDPVPYSEDTKSDWLTWPDLKGHPAFEADWTLEKKNRDDLKQVLITLKRVKDEFITKLVTRLDNCRLFEVTVRREQ